jgi:hypothetical protein
MALAPYIIYRGYIYLNLKHGYYWGRGSNLSIGKYCCLYVSENCLRFSVCKNGVVFNRHENIAVLTICTILPYTRNHSNIINELNAFPLHCEYAAAAVPSTSHPHFGYPNKSAQFDPLLKTPMDIILPTPTTFANQPLLLC